ncbi:MAG: acetate--CoA ligase family protein [Proteobacteria bacterium]|nr:acetate--CoA ligase family protein [Pseudomonadota bacterium]
MARLLEHHALEFLARAGIAVPGFEVVREPAAAGAAAERFGGSAVVKALIPVGGRGKAGAIRLARTPAAAAEAAAALLGRTVAHFPVREVLVSELVDIAREIFLSITFDSMSRKPVVLFSALGGIDIEEILAKDPARLIQRHVTVSAGLRPFEGREIAEAAGFSGAAMVALGEALAALYRLFCQLDAQTVEVNPLAVTAEEAVIAPSAVIVVDNQALFRHPELAGIADPNATNGWRPLTPRELRMREIDATDDGSSIRFNELEAGRVGFMLTGGGAGFLAFDTIMRLDGRPATTFDITPGRVEEKMYLATKEILSIPGLKGLIVGGNITNFIPIDVKVRGVMRALTELRVDPTRFPVVFRFAGPGTEESKRLAAGLPGIEYFDASRTIEDAVARIVELTRAR